MACLPTPEKTEPITGMPALENVVKLVICRDGQPPGRMLAGDH